MLKTITHVNVWVRDQDEALEFYTQKLGLEVRQDVTLEEMGGFRWLTVGPPSQPDLQMILMQPDAIPASPDTVAKLQDIVAKGAGGGVIFEVEDCRATFEELKAKGVEFVQEPIEQFYGIDAAFRDPSGNQHRFTQPAEVPQPR
jgi:catechol 2,3-dioxygenase-like lactoylglutathione lyase family enzyme